MIFWYQYNELNYAFLCWGTPNWNPVRDESYGGWKWVGWTRLDQHRSSSSQTHVISHCCHTRFGLDIFKLLQVAPFPMTSSLLNPASRSGCGSWQCHHLRLFQHYNIVSLNLSDVANLVLLIALNHWQSLTYLTTTTICEMWQYLWYELKYD